MRIRKSLKSNLLAGLALAAPFVVTVFLVQLVVNWGFGLLNPIVEGTQLYRWTSDDVLLAKLLAAGIVLVALTAIGWVAQYSVGRRMFGRAGRVVDFIPLVRTIYGSVKQVANSLTNRSSQYESVVFVEYPREGMYSIGLVTGESPGAAAELAGEPVYNVFFPASPNPTQGKLVLVPEEKVHETDLSVSRGIQLLVTTGMAEAEQRVVELEDGEFTVT